MTERTDTRDKCEVVHSNASASEEHEKKDERSKLRLHAMDIACLSKGVYKEELVEYGLTFLTGLGKNVVDKRKRKRKDNRTTCKYRKRKTGLPEPVCGDQLGSDADSVKSLD